MSFGIGLGDILLLTKFATEVCRACKHSADEFKTISGEVNSLRVVFEDIADIIEQDRSALTQRRSERLADLLASSKSVLQDLESELKHYSSLNTKTQRKYEILRFGFKDIAEIRMRIISTNTSLNSFYGSLSSHSHTFIRKILIKYAKEVNMDLHEGSILSSRTTDSFTTASGWKQICQELRDLGISASSLQENRDFIKRTLSIAIENGITSDDGDEHDLGPLTEEDRLRRESTTTLVDEEYVQRQGRRKSKHGKAVAGANPDLRELSKVTDHVDSKKYSRGVAKMLRLFGLTSDERLIEAADENDMGTILKLLGRGANVRATDKWRWTPLHMAAYAGYEDISRLLIEHGAELDVRTVDGETPLKLAERNGHAKVVQLIEEEVESRKMKELEQRGLEQKMEVLGLDAPEENEFGRFARVEDKGLWSANALGAAQVQEVELAPDEVAK
ncbi:hypothetical protein CONLIGDRAFT_453437 [Coniochaeta ligniaria NRRL 30616]|uniref:Uncharacterized protein n=1 Tax=Coniochaeta ligniaria NRRL 30616 TaxID=1408157 RepID=A0A1J7JJQ2_9PEZI|nr:hypothetical protein CONLIGDRAFT_453437 [Coniochaeta ligniaria NRRL 30616]